MGADITYTCDSAYAYTFKLVYYRYCGGVPFANPSNITKLIAIKTGASQSVSLTRTSIKEVTPLCKTASKRCYPQNTLRTGEGIEAHTFEVSIDFKKAPYSNLLKNGNCEIRFETGQCCRNSNITTGAANQNFYTYALLNLCEASVNNSPQFLYDPIGYLCCNQPNYSSVGGYDLIDFDSLSYSFAKPLRGYNNTLSYSGNYTHTEPFKAYYPGTYSPPYNNPNANPPIGIYMDPIDGSMVWTPMKCDEITVAVLEIKEWRKDTAGKYQVIGITRRDMQYVTKQCPSNNPPELTGTKTHNVKLTPCTDQYCFTISTKDAVKKPPPPLPAPDADTVSFMTPTLPSGVSFKILNPKAINPSAQICVDLKKVDIDKLLDYPMVIPITIRDNACPLNAVSTYLYRIVYDTTSTFGKVKGLTIDDKNSNCITNSNESELEYVRKVAYTKQGAYKYTEPDGSFELCIDTGTTAVKLVGNPWFIDQCVSKNVNVKKDSVHDIEFYSKLKDGIAGYVFEEESSCKSGSTPKPVSGQMVKAQPGNHYTITDEKGFYLFNVSSGNYTVSLVNDTTFWKNQCTKSVSVSLGSSETKFIDTFYNFQRQVTDLAISIGFNSGTTVRKSTDCYANLVVTNQGKSVIDSAVITVKTDNNLVTMAKSHFSWKSLGSGKYQTTVYNLLPLVKKRLSLYLATKSGYNTGDIIPFYVTSDSLSAKNDLNLANNGDTAMLRVVAPYDPNIKTAVPDSIFTVDDRRITYTVEFQNEGSASAIDVVVRDTLSKDFDLSTLQFHYGSHDYRYVLEEDQLWIIFEDINLPAKSEDYAGSMGSVTFSLELNKNIHEETVIKNRVGIYFDTEEVVLTNFQTNHFKSPIEFTDTLKKVYCIGDTVALPFTTWFKPQLDNKFLLQMTDKSGAISTFKAVDSIQTSDTFGTFSFVIPPNSASGSGYTFRVVSSNIITEMFDASYSLPITIESIENTNVVSTDSSICFGNSVLIKPSQSYFSNTSYVNGQMLSNGSKVEFSTDTLQHGDFVFFEHETINGCKSNSDTLTFNVFAIPSLSILPMDSVYCDPSSDVEIPFDLKHGQGSGSATKIYVDYGDLNTSDLDTSVHKTTHSYSKGIYEIKMTASNGLCSDSTLQTVHIGAKPSITLSTLATNICPKEELQYTVTRDSSLGFQLDSCIWYFSDGNVYAGGGSFSPSHSFLTNGSYDYEAIVHSKGCSDTAKSTVDVVAAPKGTITPNQTSACLPDADFTFNSVLTGDYTGFKWLVDGNEFTTNSITKSYSTSGKKEVTLIVQSAGVCQDTTTLSVDVFDTEVADFSIPASLCTNDTLKFSIGRPTSSSYTWQVLGSELTGPSQTIALSSHSIGAHDVKLLLETTDRCKDSLTQSFELFETPIVAFEVSNVCYPELVNLVNQTTNANANTIYNLYWGDGMTKVFKAFTDDDHRYQPGNYSIKLVATSAGCADSLTKPVEVFEKPKASFDITDIKGSVVDFENTSTNNSRNYWLFGSDNFEESNRVFTYDFDQSGMFNLRLIVESTDGCLDTITDAVDIVGVIKFFVPNAFSPNSDGLNDFYNVVPTDLIEKIEFTLYDRWGGQVLFSEDKDNLIQEDLQSGLYMYNITIIAIDGSKHYKYGTLNIW